MKTSKNIIRNLADGWHDCKALIEARAKTPDLPLKSMPKLNTKIWGIKRGRMTLIGARTSHGKSAFAVQIAYDLAAQGKAVMFLSLEMSEGEMQERIFCNQRKVDNYKLLTGHWEDYTEQFKEHQQIISKLKLSFSDCIGYSWHDIDKLLMNMIIKPDVVIVDYIQAIKNNSKNPKEAIDEYIRHFREMAMRHNFAGILCSQINRASQEEKSKEPQLHHLKGSGFLEEHSDVILLLYWPDREKPKYQLEVAKNRNGRTGFINLIYKPEYYLFEDVPNEEAKTVKKEYQKEWEE